MSTAQWGKLCMFIYILCFTLNYYMNRLVIHETSMKHMVDALAAKLKKSVTTSRAGPIRGPYSCSQLWLWSLM
jgi:hypothetical protein